MVEHPQPCTSFSCALSGVQVLVPLTNAVVTEASGAGAGQGPAGKGKAGLFILLAVLLRTRPQVRGGGPTEGAAHAPDCGVGARAGGVGGRADPVEWSGHRGHCAHTTEGTVQAAS